MIATAKAYPPTLFPYLLFPEHKRASDFEKRKQIQAERLIGEAIFVDPDVWHRRIQGESPSKENKKDIKET